MLPASGSNDWANAGDAMPATAIAAIRAILEMVDIVFFLVTKGTRTQCPVSRCRGDRIALLEFHHGSVIQLGCFIEIIRSSFFSVSGINGSVVQSHDLKPQGDVGFKGGMGHEQVRLRERPYSAQRQPGDYPRSRDDGGVSGNNRTS